MIKCFSAFILIIYHYCFIYLFIFIYTQELFGQNEVFNKTNFDKYQSNQLTNNIVKFKWDIVDYVSQSLNLSVLSNKFNKHVQKEKKLLTTEFDWSINEEDYFTVNNENTVNTNLNVTQQFKKSKRNNRTNKISKLV